MIDEYSRIGLSQFFEKQNVLYKRQSHEENSDKNNVEIE